VLVLTSIKDAQWVKSAIGDKESLCWPEGGHTPGPAGAQDWPAVKRSGLCGERKLKIVIAKRLCTPHIGIAMQNTRNQVTVKLCAGAPVLGFPLRLARSAVGAPALLKG